MLDASGLSRGHTPLVYTLTCDSECNVQRRAVQLYRAETKLSGLFSYGGRGAQAVHPCYQLHTHYKACALPRPWPNIAEVWPKCIAEPAPAYPLAHILT